MTFFKNVSFLFRPISVNVASEVRVSKNNFLNFLKSQAVPGVDYQLALCLAFTERHYMPSGRIFVSRVIAYQKGISGGLYSLGISLTGVPGECLALLLSRQNNLLSFKNCESSVFDNRDSLACWANTLFELDSVKARYSDSIFMIFQNSSFSAGFCTRLGGGNDDAVLIYDPSTNTKYSIEADNKSAFVSLFSQLFEPYLVCSVYRVYSC